MKKLQITLFLIIIFSCNGQEKNTQIKEQKLKASDNIKSKENMETVEEILKRQLEVGMSGLYDETADGETYQYESKDLDIIIPILKRQLESSGFKFLNPDEFNTKVKAIFGRVIDSKSDSKYLYISPIEKCEREIFFYRNKYTASANLPSYYIIKSANLLTELYAIPELIDYQKEYPNIAKIEDTINTNIIKNDHNIQLYLWKNEEDLPKRRRFNQLLLISRNRYLFNDDKSRFVWLTYNDAYFMESLVKTFGYTSDKKLLDWVMEKNHSQPEKIVEEAIFIKNCQGKLEIREDILKYIEETTTNDEATYAIKLMNYMVNLLDDKQTGKDIGFTNEELYKMVGYATSYIDPLYLKYNDSKTVVWGKGYIIDTYYSLLEKKEREALAQQFERNNYYNLPNLRELVKEEIGD